MSSDLLKDLFDIDGELNMMEKVAQFEYLQQMTAYEEAEEKQNWISDIFDNVSNLAEELCI